MSRQAPCQEPGKLPGWLDASADLKSVFRTNTSMFFRTHYGMSRGPWRARRSTGQGLHSKTSSAFFGLFNFRVALSCMQQPQTRVRCFWVCNLRSPLSLAEMLTLSTDAGTLRAEVARANPLPGLGLLGRAISDPEVLQRELARGIPPLDDVKLPLPPPPFPPHSFLLLIGSNYGRSPPTSGSFTVPMLHRARMYNL